MDEEGKAMALKHYCMCCERELDTSKSVWLEFDQRNGTYHDFGDIPPEFNQGGFEFGAACARRKKREALAARQGE